MRVELRALLLADPGVSTLVAGRIDWNVRPQGTGLPCIVLHAPHDQPGHTLAGSDGLSEGFVVAEAYAETYGAADAVAKAIRKLLDGFSQAPAAGPFRAVLVEDQFDGSQFYQPTLFNCISLDLRVWHTLA